MPFPLCCTGCTNMIHYVVQLWCTGCRLDRAAPATHPQMHWALLCFGQIWDILKGFQRDQSSNWFYHSWSNLGYQTLFVNCNDSNHHHVMSCIVLKLINHHPQKGFDHHKQVGDESETLWKEISVGTTVGAMLLWVPRWVLWVLWLPSRAYRDPPLDTLIPHCAMQCWQNKRHTKGGVKAPKLV